MNKPGMKDVLEHYGLQPRRGMMSCPWHDDRNPSLSVNLDLGLWMCHSCRREGDSYTFIMEMESCDFVTAKSLAEKFGIETREEDEEVGNRFTGKHKKPKKSTGPKFKMRFASGS